jgi:hypothetical protein
MTKKTFDSSRADSRGILLATACFVHCVAGPILLSYAGVSSLIGLSEKFEPLFLLGSGAMGLIAIVPAYRKKHGRKSCLALFACGLFCLLLRRHIDLPAFPAEPLVTAVGASLIAGAHLLNIRFSKRCGCCGALSKATAEATHGRGCDVASPQGQIESSNPNLAVPTNATPERNI